MSEYMDSDARADQERQEKYGMNRTVFWIYWAIMIVGVGTLLKLPEWAILVCCKSVVGDFEWRASENWSELPFFLSFWRWVFSVIFAGWLTWKLQEPRWKNPRMWKKEEPKPIEPPK